MFIKMALINNQTYIGSQGKVVQDNTSLNLIGGIKTDTLSILPQAEGTAVPIRLDSTGAIYVASLGMSSAGSATAANQIAIGLSIYNFEVENNNNLIAIGSSIYNFEVENNNNLLAIGSSLNDININLEEGNVFLETLKIESLNQGRTLDSIYYSTLEQAVSLATINTNIITQTADIDLIKDYTEYPVEVRAGMCLIARGGVVNIGGYFNAFQAGVDTTIASFGGTYDGASVQKTPSSYTINYDNALDGLGVSGVKSLFFDYIDSDYYQGTSIHILGNTGSDITPFTGYGINGVKIESMNGYGYTNLSDISIYDNGMSNYQALIPTGKSATNQLIYNVPYFNKLLIGNMTFNTTRLIGNSPKIKINGYVFNRNKLIETDIFELEIDTNIENSISYTPNPSLVIDEKEVFYLRAISDYNNSVVRGRISGLLLPIPIPPPSFTVTIFTGSLGVYYLDKAGILTQTDISDANIAVGGITKMEVGTAITVLSGNLFFNNIDIITVIFRDIENSQCTNIGSKCFRNCSNLTTCVLPQTILTLNVDCFYLCTSLGGSDPIPDDCTSLGGFSYANTKITKVTIKSHVVFSTSFQFSGCSLLTSLIFNASLAITIIPQNCFLSCALTSVAIPIQITTLGGACFKNNPIDSVQLGIGLTSIGDECFNSTIITQVLWDAGNARTCSIGINCFGSTGMTAYNGTIYDVPLGGALFF